MKIVNYINSKSNQTKQNGGVNSLFQTSLELREQAEHEEEEENNSKVNKTIKKMNKLIRNLEKANAKTMLENHSSGQEYMSELMNKFSDNQQDLSRDLNSVIETFNGNKFDPEQLEAMVEAEQNRSKHILQLASFLDCQVNKLYNVIENVFERVQNGKIIPLGMKESVSSQLNLVQESIDSMTKIVISPAQELEETIDKAEKDITQANNEAKLAEIDLVQYEADEEKKEKEKTESVHFAPGTDSGQKNDDKISETIKQDLVSLAMRTRRKSSFMSRSIVMVDKGMQASFDENSLDFQEYQSDQYDENDFNGRSDNILKRQNRIIDENNDMPAGFENNEINSGYTSFQSNGPYLRTERNPNNSNEYNETKLLNSNNIEECLNVVNENGEVKSLSSNPLDRKNNHSNNLLNVMSWTNKKPKSYKSPTVSSNDDLTDDEINLVNTYRIKQQLNPKVAVTHEEVINHIIKNNEHEAKVTESTVIFPDQQQEQQQDEENNTEKKNSKKKKKGTKQKKKTSSNDSIENSDTDNNLNQTSLDTTLRSSDTGSKKRLSTMKPDPKMLGKTKSSSNLLVSSKSKAGESTRSTMSLRKNSMASVTSSLSLSKKLSSLKQVTSKIVIDRKNMNSDEENDGGDDDEEEENVDSYEEDNMDDLRSGIFSNNTSSSTLKDINENKDNKKEKKIKIKKHKIDTVNESDELANSRDNSNNDIKRLLVNQDNEEDESEDENENEENDIEVQNDDKKVLANEENNENKQDIDSETLNYVDPSINNSSEESHSNNHTHNILNSVSEQNEQNEEESDVNSEPSSADNDSFQSEDELLVNSGRNDGNVNDIEMNDSSSDLLLDQDNDAGIAKLIKIRSVLFSQLDSSEVVKKSIKKTKIKQVVDSNSRTRGTSTEDLFLYESKMFKSRVSSINNDKINITQPEYLVNEGGNSFKASFKKSFSSRRISEITSNNLSEIVDNDLFKTDYGRLTHQVSMKMNRLSHLPQLPSQLERMSHNNAGYNIFNAKFNEVNGNDNIYNHNRKFQSNNKIGHSIINHSHNHNQNNHESKFELKLKESDNPLIEIYNQYNDILPDEWKEKLLKIAQEDEQAQDDEQTQLQEEKNEEKNELFLGMTDEVEDVSSMNLLSMKKQFSSLYYTLESLKKTCLNNMSRLQFCENFTSEILELSKDCGTNPDYYQEKVETLYRKLGVLDASRMFIEVQLANYRGMFEEIQAQGETSLRDMMKKIPELKASYKLFMFIQGKTAKLTRRVRALKTYGATVQLLSPHKNGLVKVEEKIKSTTSNDACLMEEIEKLEEELITTKERYHFVNNELFQYMNRNDSTPGALAFYSSLNDPNIIASFKLLSEELYVLKDFSNLSEHIDFATLRISLKKCVNTIPYLERYVHKFSSLHKKWVRRRMEVFQTRNMTEQDDISHFCPLCTADKRYEVGENTMKEIKQNIALQKILAITRRKPNKNEELSPEVGQELTQNKTSVGSIKVSASLPSFVPSSVMPPSPLIVSPTMEMRARQHTLLPINHPVSPKQKARHYPGE